MNARVRVQVLDASGTVVRDVDVTLGMPVKITHVPAGGSIRVISIEPGPPPAHVRSSGGGSS